MKTIRLHYEKLTFYALVLLWLLPVWTVSYFLTGDGPCHLYNSKILLDWIQGRHTDMYHYFMNSNPHLDPNWITNLIQVPLLAVFAPALAEKVFYTFYLLGFAFGFRFLIKQISPKALYLCSIGLIFAWHHIVFKGFSNNTLSIAIWFWIVGCWLKYQEAPLWKAVLLQMIITLVGYFSHPMGFVYSAIMIACLLAGQTIHEMVQSGFSHGLKLFCRQLLRLVIAYLPALILLFIFVSRRSWSGENSGYNNEVWQNFIKMPALVALNYKEEIFARAVSFCCFLLLAISVADRLRKKGFRRTDGLFLFVIIVFLTIISPPASILGGLDVPRRLIMLPFLAILFLTATVQTNRKWEITTIIFSMVITIGLLIQRLPILWQTSAFAAEIVSCKEKINPLSTVMTLNYDLEPHSVKGEKIIDAEWTNVHTDCYIGVYKPVILADNYELNFDYFPFTGVAERSFYYHSQKEGTMFEAQIPRVDFNAYKEITGIQIDYIILAGMNEEQRRHTYTLEIMDQLAKDYEKIYTSPHGVAILYKSKSGFRNPWLQ